MEGVAADALRAQLNATPLARALLTSNQIGQVPEYVFQNSTVSPLTGIPTVVTLWPMKIVTLISMLMLVCSPAFSAPLQSGCNDTERAKEVDPGWNGHSDSCTIVDIPGLTTPSSCVSYFTFYSSAVYGCTGGTVENIHCKANGYKVKTTSGTDGACPGAAFEEYLSEIDEISDLWDLPGALASLSKCVPTQNENSFDWSAASKDCLNGNAPIFANLETSEATAGGQQIEITFDTAFSQYSHLNTTNPFVSEYDLAQTGDELEVGGAMGAILRKHLSISGLSFSAKVSFEFLGPEETVPNHVETVGVSGSIREDGLFQATYAQIIPFEGEPVLALDKVTFDGSALTWRDTENPYGNIWPIGVGSFEGAWSLQTKYLVPIYQWCVDPFSYPLFSEGVTFEESTDSATGNLVASRSFIGSSGQEFIGTEYFIDESTFPTHPVTLKYRLPSGQVCVQADYSDYHEVAENTWRPRKVVTTYYIDGIASGNRIVVKLTFADANVLTPDEIENVPAISTKEQIWQVWQ